ncbi:MAG: pyridoxamine 5'-phosphate oxidase [Chromatiales bacterium]|jgi:nitroimidazol reductase NimA-like FMN-containing flavoprotein (pyridoxamine 5'-phosphate oxidase superfamily)|nr:pyridoxamine 5'-phosphate oxidase [Chromatiales bacterium]MDP6150939.1 pyridoxamine 5'-phosphate oxidase family protein [Gammaproteobacteria bacterium]MDP7270907.1 pyridoxamine 5'-phosphate oxidase family protein [Gammaproteobacteria bacterium]HJP05581.1 pyridoxamine 5'-phosphate oxidase family protein [Gammaproteobacteria bacterium]
MSYPYPWIRPPYPDKELPRGELERRIQETLMMANTCVLATLSKKGMPVASPVEYYNDGFDVYMLPDAGSPKLTYMEKNADVSLAVHKNHNTWAHARGVQYFGKAEVLPPRSPGWKRGMEVFRWRVWAEELGQDLDKPPEQTLVKVRPQRIMYTDTYLWREGYGARQTWRAE